MGTTTNFGWPTPELSDEPDGRAQITALAVAADADLKDLADTVDALPGGGGGGGGGGFSGDGGTWRAPSSQSIPATVSGPGTPVLLSTADGTPTGVTASAASPGTRFVLVGAGLWVGGLIGRWTTTTVGGVRDFAIYYDPAGGTSYTQALTSPNPQTVTGQPKGGAYSFARYLPAGTALVVYAYNGTGSPRTLEHNGGQWVALDLWRLS